MLSDGDYFKHQILQKLHEDNEWSDELLSFLFSYEVSKVLQPVERIVLEHKVAGMADGEISILLGIKLDTVKRYTRDIKYVLRNQMRRRADNSLLARRKKGYYGKGKRNKH